MKTLLLLIVITIISFCIVSVNPSYSMCTGAFQPNIQRDNGIDAEGYHTYLASMSDNQTYPIKYKISSGAVIEEISSETSSSPILNIIVREVSQGGNLTIQLPTKLLGLYSVGGYSVAEGTACADIINKNFPIPMKSNLNFTTVEFPLMNNSGVDEMIYITGNQQPSTTSEFPSPLKQFQSGVDIRDIVCKEGLYLVVKSHNQDPMCLKAGTISKLASRGFLYGTSAGNTNYTTIIIPPGSENQDSHNTYSPDTAIVVLGINNTVQWTSQADVGNEIAPDMPLTQNGQSFGSDGIIKPGESYKFTFTEPGTFTYHTEPHPWMKGTVIVLPKPNGTDISAAKTYNLKQVHYYGNSNQNPKVSLYDYSYAGIDKDGLVTIGNQTFYQTTLDNDIYKLKDTSIQFHNVTFSFPEGTLVTPGGAFVNLDVKFQDGSEEIYGGTMSNPDGSGAMIGGIQIPTPYGPHLAVNSITVIGNHAMPQAGLTIYHDMVKLLVSDDNKTSQTIPQCVSNIQNQYAIAGPRGDMLCPILNFQASGKIVNYTGFYGVYGYAEYAGTPNFVLEPGHNGTFSYEIDIGSIYNWGNQPSTNNVNITNGIEFMHDAGMHDHPGVTTSIDSKSEIIQKNNSAFVTITFAATGDAKPGTYWVDLPPSFCAGGKVIILTVTNCEK